MKKKDKLVIEWERVKDANNKVGHRHVGTQGDEADFTRHQSKNIDIMDTAVGCVMQCKHPQQWA